MEYQLYGQLIAILLCSSIMFQIRNLLLTKKKQELSKYKSIYMIKYYFSLLFRYIQNILRLVVQTKALVRTTIFYIVEVKRRSWVS
ncbi:hypothetical protein AC241_30750 (plasmid) [Bacillus thuringiensis]|nr:hypothetical protein AC241_30750 [Bacillus thuringiensis]